MSLPPGPRPGHYNNFAPPAIVAVWQKRALIVGVVFAIGSIIGWVLEADQFYRSYLLGYMWCLELTLGSLGMVMLYHLTGGAWGTPIRRIFEAGMSNVWLMLVLFIPVAVGVHHLYPWTRPEYVAHSAHVQRITAQYLNLKFWFFRAALYFLASGLLVVMLKKMSRRQDREDVILDNTLRGISAPGLLIYLFVTLFLYIDWIMSITPNWSSMIYSLIFNAGHGLAAISMAVILAAALVRYEPMRDIIKPDQFLDHGKIMLTFIMLWGWWTYAQWIIFWSGNLPDEISWYVARTRGGWEYWGFALIMVYFCIPFALLLSRSFKSNPRHLMKLAVWTLLARYVDLYWFIMPGFPDREGHFHYSWLDAVVPIALAGFWFSLMLRTLAKYPLLAVHDDHVKIILEEGHEFEQERA